MRPPWGELAFAMSLVSLVLLIAGFNWNAWLTAKGKDESSSSMAYDLQAGPIFEAARITVTSSLAIFVTALCILSIHLLKCIQYPGLAVSFYIGATLLGVLLLVASLVLSLVEQRHQRRASGGDWPFSWGFYVEWAAVATYVLSALFGVMEKLFPRPRPQDQPLVGTGDHGVYRGD